MIKNTYVRKRRLAVKLHKLHKLRLAHLFYFENSDIGSFFSYIRKRRLAVKLCLNGNPLTM